MTRKGGLGVCLQTVYSCVADSELTLYSTLDVRRCSSNGVVGRYHSSADHRYDRNFTRVPLEYGWSGIIGIQQDYRLGIIACQPKYGRP